MGNPRQSVISFNPSWCFRPPASANDAGKRFPVDVGVGSVAGSSTRPKSGRRLLRAKFSIPTSPKIGWLGQIKGNAPQHRRPSPSASSSSSSSSSSSTTTTSSKSSSSSRGKSKLLQFTLALLRRNSNQQQTSSELELKVDRATSPASRRISLDTAPANNMDPPLLVELRRPRVTRDGNLWERRCGEGGLTGLDLERRSLQNVNLYPVVA